MEQKGLVGHEAEGKIYAYFARVEREAVLSKLARGFLDRVFDGAMDEYLVHALELKRLSAAELARLEALIAQAKTTTRKRSGKESGK
jgi:predicted transcriptional regulator